MAHTLSVRNLSKKFGRKPVLRDVSLEAHNGKVVGLLGANGAGKSTCFNILTGMLKPDGGSIFLDNEYLNRMPIHARAKLGLAYLAQDSSIFRHLSVLDNVLAILEIQGVVGEEAADRASFLLGELGVRHLMNQMPLALSGGERRRVEIARVLAIAPKFILFDEPFAAIEPIAIADLQNLIARLATDDIGVVLTDHNVRETLRICDYAYVIHDGVMLAEGAPQDIINNEDVKRAYLGASFN